MRHHDGRALTDEEIEEIHKNVFNGCYHDEELLRLFETVIVQKEVLRKLFNLFKSEPMRRVSNTDPVNNSTLAYLKERVSLEDSQ